MEAVLTIVTAVVNQLPAMVQLGVDLAEIIPELKKAIDALTGSGTISDADAQALAAKVADAEGAWAAQVAAAQAEQQAGSGSSGSGGTAGAG